MAKSTATNDIIAAVPPTLVAISTATGALRAGNAQGSALRERTFAEAIRATAAPTVNMARVKTTAARNRSANWVLIVVYWSTTATASTDTTATTPTARMGARHRSKASPSRSTTGCAAAANWRGQDIDERQRLSVVRELLPGRQLKVRLRFVCGEPVRKGHRALAVAAAAVAFLQVQALEMIGSGRPIAALHPS